jgi:hypothetical protein
MINHPPQREMWEGLTGIGCLAIIIFIIVPVIGVFI